MYQGVSKIDGIAIELLSRKVCNNGGGPIRVTGADTQLKRQSPADSANNALN